MRRHSCTRAIARYSPTSRGQIVLLAFDYDGTLAPIASTPARARLPATTRRLLTEHRPPLPVRRDFRTAARRRGETARGHSDLVRLRQLRSRAGAARPSPPTRVGDWARRLTERLPTHRGLVVEEKRYSVTIHYRHARDKRRALRTIEAVRELPDARAIGGTQAMTLLPRTAPTRGSRCNTPVACSTAIKRLYVGDDDTDEDAFASASAENLLSIRVGTTRTSCARYRLRRQADIDRYYRRSTR